MTHILGLDDETRQSVINNLLLMGMGDFTPDIATPQINAIGLNFSPTTPLRDVASQFDSAPRSVTPVPVPPPLFRADIVSLSLTDSPPPRPPRSPRRPCSPRIVSPPLPIVEDDKSPRGGVKTSLASVLTQDAPTNEPSRRPTLQTSNTLVLPTPTLDESPPLIPPPRPPRSPLREYRPLFLGNAFERPRDPDEVVPQAPPRPPAPRPAQKTNRDDTRNAIPTTTTKPVDTRNRDRQTHDARRSRRTLYATNNDIHRWLQQIIHNPPPRPQYRPPPPLGNITEERTDTDPELCEYRYDRTYDHAGEGQND
ncbi:hypothetical protein EDB86DRAFT_2830159 [Lactarius hatsudake]|nr:hypothetical protein EDB86DRAFT_2830159 [Lactarius hatsudake]